MKDICVFFGTGYEEIEALTVVDILRRGGLPVKMVSITGEYNVTSSHQVTVKMDALFDEIDFDQVEMIVLPGGMPGTKNLEAFEPLMEQVEAFDKAGQTRAEELTGLSLTLCTAKGEKSHLEIIL